MNIAYIVPSLANKGPVIVVKDLVAQMVKNGQQCTVFYFDDICEIEFLCPVYRISLYKRIDFGQYDIVHTHGIRPDFYVFMHKPLKGTTKFITTMHNFVMSDFIFQYNRIFAFIFGHLWMLLIQRHDKVITLTQYAIQYYRRWIRPSRLMFAYNTRVLDRSETLSIEEEKLITCFRQDFLIIGVNAQLTYLKGIDLLIRALPNLPMCKLFVVGDGKIKEELLLLAKEYKVHDRVLFAGYQKNAYRYLRYYDLYAMPSRSEGFGLSLLEAGMYKMPSICSDIPVFRELFTTHEVVFFTLEDIVSLEKAVRYAISHPELGERMYEKYINSYSPEVFYKKYLSIYLS